MKFIPTWLMLLIGLPGIAQPQSVGTSSEQHKEQMLVDGMKRSFVTYVPVVDKPERMPVIISLHGGFASPEGMFHLADFRPIADKEKFIVVCPASKHIWHDGADIHGIDDVKFIDQIITYVIDTYHADAERIYVTGISNGGFMTTRLACQLHKRIAAIAVVAASLDVKAGYDIAAPMPVIYMHGTKDGIVPYKGGKLFGKQIYSQQEIIKKWAAMDNCNPTPIITNLPDDAHDGTSVVKEEYINTVTHFKVIGYTITNGGHTWPGGWQYAPKFIVGKTTKNLNACQVIWDFFKEYKLKS